MINIRYALLEDADFWFSLDQHLPKKEYQNKVAAKQAYIILDENKPVGILRYSLFWDEIPFCNLIYLKQEYQNRGFGKKLMDYWHKEMQEAGYVKVLVSTQVDEQAQHFYRKLGYEDCGGLILKDQTMELFLIKEIAPNN